MSQLKYTIIDAFVTDGLLNQRVELSVPLEHQNPSNTAKITISANITQKYKKEIHENLWESVTFPTDANVLAYLQGGPGFPCTVPVLNSGYTKVLIEKGYQLVLYDQRGTGLSTQIEVGTLTGNICGVTVKPGQAEIDPRTTKLLLEYVLNFRADSIVEDMEIVRRALVGDDKWTLLGQSYGGFCIFTYLCRHKEALKEVYITGGVPPVGFTAEDVYEKTYERTKERNVHYYAKYPQDIARVKEIMAYLSEHPLELPNRGTLSVERFQQLGLAFGGTGGTDALHQIVSKFHHALKLFGKPTYEVLHTVQNATSFGTNVLYALFQEAIYCDGANEKGPKMSDWAADRLRHRPQNKQFKVTSESLKSDDAIFFTGEMVYKSMYDDYAELVPLKNLAYALHEYKDWSPLYDVETLSKIQWHDVPIIATTYYSDQYVDFELTMAVKKQVFQKRGNSNLRQYITNELFHNGLRADPQKVLGSLFKLRQEEYD